jgi:aldehyde:ferredoxin oxidoreductase
MHSEYYQAFGWDRNGNPKEETIGELGLAPILGDRLPAPSKSA